MPFFSGDKPLAVQLAEHILRLGGVQHHDCLLVVDKSTDESGVIEPLQEAFQTVHVCPSAPAGAQGAWGTGTTDATAANEMWINATNFIFHRLKQPFFWLESDAAPMYPAWLDDINAEYKVGGKPFMGALVNIPPHELHMSGIGCYPFDVANHSLAMAVPGKIAWDYAGRGDTVGKKKAHFTNLIQHEYRIHGESPTFPTLESLSVIRPETAVFHRCKDGTLIERLSERAALASVPAKSENRGFADSPPSLTPAQPPLEQSSAPTIGRIVDLRGFNAEGMPALGLRPELIPVRMEAFNYGPMWENARYELRTVETSSLPGVVAGDKIIFSRVAEPGELKPCYPKAKRIKKTRNKDTRSPEKIAADKARMAKARAARGRVAA